MVQCVHFDPILAGRTYCSSVPQVVGPEWRNYGLRATQSSSKVYLQLAASNSDKLLLFALTWIHTTLHYFFAELVGCHDLMHVSLSETRPLRFSREERELKVSQWHYCLEPPRLCFAAALALHEELISGFLNVPVWTFRVRLHNLSQKSKGQMPIADSFFFFSVAA